MAFVTGRAVVLHEHGGTDKLQVVTDFTFPPPGPKQVRIKVAGVGINPVDVYVRMALKSTTGMFRAKSFPLARARARAPAPARRQSLHDGSVGRSLTLGDRPTRALGGRAGRPDARRSVAHPSRRRRSPRALARRSSAATRPASSRASARARPR